MTTNKKRSAAYLFEKYRVSLENSKNQPIIASKMAENGFTSEKIDEGINLLAHAKAIYLHKKTEDNESKEASLHLKSTKASLNKLYLIHREKARIVFKNNAVILDKLAINQKLKMAFYDWVNQVKLFYEVAISNEEIQTKLNTLNLSKTELEEGLNLVVEVESARAEYVREKGESQDATKQKKAAMDAIDNWMSVFYRIAKLALKDHPQLLESLDKMVKD